MISAYNIKPCKFCGTPARVVESYAGYDIFCPCYECQPGSFKFAKTLEKAVELWNEFYGLNEVQHKEERENGKE